MFSCPHLTGGAVQLPGERVGVFNLGRCPHLERGGRQPRRGEAFRRQGRSGETCGFASVASFDKLTYFLEVGSFLLEVHLTFFFSNHNLLYKYVAASLMLILLLVGVMLDLVLMRVWVLWRHPCRCRACVHLSQMCMCGYVPTALLSFSSWKWRSTRSPRWTRRGTVRFTGCSSARPYSSARVT